MTPDEQPQPVAWLHTVVNGDDDETDQALSFAPDNFPLQGTFGYRSIAVKPLYAHPPTSAASQPDAVRVRSALERLRWVFNLTLAGKPCRDVTETLAEVESALNPPAEPSAREKK